MNFKQVTSSCIRPIEKNIEKSWTDVGFSATLRECNPGRLNLSYFSKFYDQLA